MWQLSEVTALRAVPEERPAFALAVRKRRVQFDVRFAL